MRETSQFSLSSPGNSLPVYRTLEDKIRELLDPKMTVRFFLLSELACKNDKLNKYAKKFRVTQTLTYMKKQRSQLPSIHVNKIEKACLQAYKITIIRFAI